MHIIFCADDNEPEKDCDEYCDETCGCDSHTEGCSEENCLGKGESSVGDGRMGHKL